MGSFFASERLKVLQRTRPSSELVALRWDVPRYIPPTFLLGDGVSSHIVSPSFQYEYSATPIDGRPDFDVTSFDDEETQSTLSWEPLTPIDDFVKQPELYWSSFQAWQMANKT